MPAPWFPCPPTNRVAGMLARAFYREMRHCGFSPNQIIHAAGEIISELTSSLNRHKRRIRHGADP